MTETKGTYTARPVVYVSGPYTTGDTAVNVARAIEAAEMLWKAGYAPIVPHLSFLWQMRYPHTWDEWITLDLAILDKCDCIYRVPGESKGADIEMAFAKENGIKELFPDSGIWIMDIEVIEEVKDE
jgi:hypothetical protein